MYRTITLTPSVSGSNIKDYWEGYRLRLAVTAATGVDPHIFLFLAEPLRPGQTEPVARFQKVCSPRDLAQFPVGEPAEGASPAWFRLDAFTCDFDTSEEVQSTIQLAAVQVQQLLDALASMDTLAALEPITLGAGS